MEKPRILGLDIGTNSIGWILLDTVQQKIIGLGSRIFSPPVEAKNEIPKNQKRREARGRRRNLSRRAGRKRNLVRLLKANCLLPESHEDFEKLLLEDPYQLRVKALDEKISLHQFGRALFHINQRRGFQSNRKTDKKKETGKIIPAINNLKETLEKSDARTIGEFLAKNSKKRFAPELKDALFPNRDMYKDEFEALWNAQKEFHPELTSELNVRIFREIFNQRPLKIQKHLIGLCSLERGKTTNSDGKSVVTGKKRCAKSHPFAQRFRFLQDVNNLTVNGELLSQNDREKLVAYLATYREIKWDRVRTLLELPEHSVFNMENSKKKIIGATTECSLSTAVGKKNWKTLDEQKREDVYLALHTIHNEDALLNRLKNGLGFSDETAEKLAKVDLENGYANLSLKAINRLMPYLEQGLKYYEALEEAGYTEKTGSARFAKPGLLSEPPEIRNPVVQKALHEVRKVVNGIITAYGTPDIARIEFVRDLKQTRERRREIQSEQNRFRDEREEARKTIINDFGISDPSRDDILKYRLWQESEQRCPYTGQTISASMLFSPAVNIEHIIPWTRSLNDSYMNKTLCMAGENQKKHNKTPWEAYGEDEETWERIKRNIKKLPLAKKRRFYLQEVEKDFKPSQLTDTAYIARETRDYLQTVFPKVQTVNGRTTAIIRRGLGLNTVLPGADDPNLKNRSDHRHHTVDAAVIALVDTSLVKMLSMANSRYGKVTEIRIDPPWEGFRDELKERLSVMIVSHAVSRKIAGALHEETSYWRTPEKADKKGYAVYTYRKSLPALSKNEVEKIRDMRIRKMVLEKLAEYGGNLKKTLQETYALPNKNGEPVPVRSVRLLAEGAKGSYYPLKNPEGEVYRYVKLGNNHHIEIFINEETGQKKGRVVTAMEAAKRARLTKEPIINRNPEPDFGPDWRFLMSLAINEMVEVEETGKKRLFSVQQIPQRGQMMLREHFYAETKNPDPRFVFTKYPNSLHAQKVNISPIGEITPAND